MAQLNAQQQEVVARFHELESTDAKFQTLQAMRAELIPQADAGKTRLWTMLFTVLGLALVILCVGALLLLLDDKETGAALLLAPVSAIIAGLLGLFASSPLS